MTEGDRENAIAPLHRLHAVDDAAQRRAMRVEGIDHPAVIEGHCRTNFAGERPLHQPEQLAGNLLDVRMRIFLVGGDHGRIGEHAVGDMAMQIKFGGDRHIRPDQAAHMLEQIPLDIVIAFGDAGAVQGKHDGIDRQGRLEVAKDGGAEAFIDRPRGPAAWLGHGAQALHHAPGLFLSGLAPDRHLRRAAVERPAGGIAVGDQVFPEGL
ncbi:hypothetical protein D9M72_522230 [compost metagenome]